ncbi:MAG: DNA polymerase III subunit gamma/tau [Actinomycetia bacterium]|nr:DNA polymerase III subunit gamma/tau [Actinomycetes bacterium]MCP5030332.1 DNA polymerase III subunit gamma/tau [Actinomycetes bacterium]
MAYQSLYRRYRSRKFSEVLGQPHVTSALRTAIAEGRESHAYLFSGPRGTGKTSTARVLAKALNCENLSDGEPCTTCESCVAIEEGKSFDLHELDAASHNKVDDVRDLISKVQLGSPGRTKVYILDEVHMLSSGAENALLKTLEEPPEHVVFVLATTEPQKVVATIRSRTQHHEFRLLPAEVLAEHVRWIIEEAGLEVAEETIDYVLRQGGGSARDTLSALDLVAAAGGIPEGSDIAETLIQAIGEHDPAKAIGTVQEGLELGREPRTMGEDLMELLRNAFLCSMGAPLAHLNDHTRSTVDTLSESLGAPTLTRSLEAIGQCLVEMRQAADPRVPLEVTLLRLTRTPNPTPTSTPVSTGTATSPTPTSHDPAAAERITALEARIAELEAKLTAGAAANTQGDKATSTPEPGPDSTGGKQGRRPPPPRSGRRPARRPEAQTGGPTEQAPTKASDTNGADPNHPTPSTPMVVSRQQQQPAGTTQSAAPLTEAAVTAAMTTQLDDLSQKVRVRFKGGRILQVADGIIRFGVPNTIHRDRCRDVKDEVEQALTSHFNQPVSLEIVVDEEGEPPTDPAKLEPRKPGPLPDDNEDDIGPVEDLADATEAASGSVDRITKAFPGSKVIDSPAP